MQTSPWNRGAVALCRDLLACRAQGVGATTPHDGGRVFFLALCVCVFFFFLNKHALMRITTYATIFGVSTSGRSMAL